jgi:hypothetical protein
MPTANTKTTKATKTRAKAGAKPAAAKAGRTQAKRPQAKAAQSRATSSRTNHQASSTFQQAQSATRDTAGVGAALIARERVASTVSDTLSTYSSTTKTQAQLRKFERRGATARNRLEREVRKARVRVERELRQRRRTIESTVSDLDERREAIAKNGTEIAGMGPELANRVQERILTLV